MNNLTHRTIYSFLMFLCFLSLTKSEIRKDYGNSKKFTFSHSPKNNQYVHLGQPKLTKLSTYMSYLLCNPKQCYVKTECVQCPHPFTPLVCLVNLSKDVSLSQEKPILYTVYDQHGHWTIIDWVSNAIVPTNSAQKRNIQIVNMDECSVHEFPLQISSSDNEMRKMLIRNGDNVILSFLYSDFKHCKDGGWRKVEFNRLNSKLSFECIRNIESSTPLFAMDAVHVDVRTGKWDYFLDKDVYRWTLYNVSKDSFATVKYAVDNQEDSLFDLPRLSDLSLEMPPYGILCWLPDVEFSNDIKCHFFSTNSNSFIWNLTLSFPYKVRDFEVQFVDGIVALTSSAENTNCHYDLWKFNSDGRPIEEPVRIEGPRCAFSHRLEPRPLIVRRGDGFCVSFLFEHLQNRHIISEEQIFSMQLECFIV